MTKYVFNGCDSDVVHLDDEGELTTDSMYADVKFKIDRDDNDVQLTINSQHFDADDLSDLINFLKALKEEISK